MPGLWAQLPPEAFLGSGLTAGPSTQQVIYKQKHHTGLLLVGPAHPTGMFWNSGLAHGKHGQGSLSSVQLLYCPPVAI